MSNMKYKVLVLATCFAIGGCDDILETVPTHRISTEIFWKTDQDALLAANAVYTSLFENASHYVSWDGMSDIGYTHQPQSAESFILQGQFDALNSRVKEDWTNLYAGIRAANSFLTHVENLQPTNANLINRLKGEVKALRAYFYTRLAALYGDVPLHTTEVSLEESKTVGRTPVSEVWDFISTELTDAAALLPNTQTDKGRITKGAALGILARAMLYAGRYQAAADAAKAVMDLNVYSIYPSYQNLFSYAAENNAEVILDIQFIDDAYSNNIFNVLAQSSMNSRSLYVPTKNLVDAYEMTNGLPITDGASGFDPLDPYANRDPRLGYSIFLPGDVLPNSKVFNPKPNSTTGDAVGSTFVVSPTGFNLQKYVNAEDLGNPSNCGINLILMRYPEILLTYAEAKVELNPIDQSVYDAINDIRQRPDVNMPEITTGKSQDELRTIIRHERLVELAFEGLRFFDIRRWRIAGDVMPGKVYGMTYVDDNAELQTVEVTALENFFSERNYLWPIPQTERELNTNLSQNDDW